MNRNEVPVQCTVQSSGRTGLGEGIAREAARLVNLKTLSKICYLFNLNSSSKKI
jgi:hypothetical protein